MIDYKNLEHLEIVRGVLEEIADTLPEVRDTELWRENMPVQIETWADWERYERDGQQEEKILEWLQQEFLNHLLHLHQTLLGGGLVGLEITGEKLHALVTTDYGLGIYVNADSDLAIASQHLVDAKENFACPKTFVRVMATVIKLTVMNTPVTEKGAN